MIVKLIVHGGKNEGAVIAINKPQFIIGRLPECNLRIESKALSRRHAQIDVKDGSVTVKDLGSTNGTFVNGEVLSAKSVVLHKYDLITLGEHTDLIVMSSRAAKRYLGSHILRSRQ